MVERKLPGAARRVSKRSEHALANSIRQALGSCRPQASGFPIIVAVSGGLDSLLLLHLCAEIRSTLPGPLSAIHVNHHLHPEADVWAALCREACEARGVAFALRDVYPDPAAPNLEARARSLRQEAFRAVAAPGSVFLLGHHRDDQAETLLFRIFRGSGLAGLGGMKVCGQFPDKVASGRADSLPALSPRRTARPRGTQQEETGLLMVRPWLQYSKQTLREEAQRLSLQWVEDSSNFSEQFDRNYLRHSVLPAITTRFPEALDRMAIVCQRLQIAEQVCAAWADTQLAAWRDLAAWPRLSAMERTLDLGALAQVEPALHGELLRQWLASLSLYPAEAQLEELVRQCQTAGAGLDQRVAGWRLRKYRSALYAERIANVAAVEADVLVPAEAPPPADASSLERAGASARMARTVQLKQTGLTSPGECWDGREPLPWSSGIWIAPISPTLQSRGPYAVRVRKAGDRLYDVDAGQHRSLKTAFQARSIPPWQRAQWPLLIQEGMVCAILHLQWSAGAEAV